MPRTTKFEKADMYYNAELAMLRQLAARKLAHVVFANGKPFYTAFSASTAYSLMSALHRAGVRSVYRPAV